MKKEERAVLFDPHHNGITKKLGFLFEDLLYIRQSEILNRYGIFIYHFGGITPEKQISRPDPQKTSLEFFANPKGCGHPIKLQDLEPTDSFFVCSYDPSRSKVGGLLLISNTPQGLAWREERNMGASEDLEFILQTSGWSSTNLELFLDRFLLEVL